MKWEVTLYSTYRTAGISLVRQISGHVTEYRGIYVAHSYFGAKRFVLPSFSLFLYNIFLCPLFNVYLL